jgi:hypothetical protein
MRYESQFKEQYSLAYVRAVAALAGCDVNGVSVDVNGIDLTIAETDDERHPMLPKVDVQMKCTARETVIGPDYLVFDLDVNTFRKLRRPATVPKILVVVYVPKNPADWIVQGEDEMHLRHCAYWQTFHSESDTANDTAIRVRLPRAQIFNVTALQAILSKINKDGKL